MTEIFTVGHSNKPVESFIELLTAADIGVLVDVRSVPWSRYNPQFNENALKIELRKVGIHYVSRGKNLGGKGENVDYEKALDDLKVRAESGERIAICCSEGHFKGCHRFTMLTPPLEDRGLDVVHIMWTGELLANSSPRATPPKPIAEQGMFDMDVVSFPKIRKNQWIAP